jgi:error-prone DNA polymerase
MAAWKRRGDQMERFGRRLVEGMTARGYPREFAERCFEQIKGFSEYGFPESHAASFALLVYVSAWLKKWHPAVFAAGLINSQPMGFYAPAQIVRDAREHGVEVRGVDVNSSQWDCTLEDEALRLGMRLVRSLREDQALAITDAVAQHGSYGSIRDLWRGSGVRVSTLRHLASADAFGSMGLDRQAALWEIRVLSDEKLPLFDQQPDEPNGSHVSLPPVDEPRKVIQDYAALGLSLKAHPVSFLRPMLGARAPAAGDRLRHRVHDHRGRNGNRQPDRQAAHLPARPPGRPPRGRGPRPRRRRAPRRRGTRPGPFAPKR